MNIYVAAVDLGASSGRVLLAQYGAARQTLAIEEIHRFENGFVRRDGKDCWNVENLVAQINFGLEEIIARGIVPASVGIDTWGVDFVLLDANGKILGQPVAYRDHRTDDIMEEVFKTVPRTELYARTGIQFMQFNTIFQLAALKRENPEWLPQAKTLLLMADYLHYRLGGVMSCEYTNASTTQLLSLDSNTWDFDLLASLGLPPNWFQPLCEPGTHLGEWTSRNGSRVKIITPPTHDTASAVAATPMVSGDAVYISSGTWSLMGIESTQPFNDDSALAANITNEGGIDRRYRVLKNIMGLWLIQRVRDAFPEHSFADLVVRAESAVPFRFLINPNDVRFLNPASMVDAIREFCQETGQGTPQNAGDFARCVFESLAFVYRQTLNELGAISGKRFARIHIVGGGSQNAFLNQLCADFCHLPVHTGPVEASALGNVACQLRSLGVLRDLNASRDLIRKEFAGQTLMPRADLTNAVEPNWQRFQHLCRPNPTEQRLTIEGAVS